MKLSKLTDIFSLIPFVMIPFAGIAVFNTNITQGVISSRIFIFLRYEFWIFISILFNLGKILRYNYSNIFKSFYTKAIIFTLPFAFFLIIIFSTLFNIYINKNYLENFLLMTSAI